MHPRFKIAVILFLALNLALIGPAHAADFPPNPPEKPGCHLTFDEEFNGTDIDWTKWTNYRYGMKHYTVKDGILSMWLEPDGGTAGIMTFTKPGISGGYTAPNDGAAFHGFGQKYGYYEIRMKVPDCGGGGHTAWWMIGCEDDRPPAAKTQQNGEIDITEQLFTKTDDWRMKFHPWNDPTFKNLDGPLHFHTTNSDKEFHLYAMDWDSTGTRFYFDNVKVAETPLTINYRMATILSMYSALKGKIWDGNANAVYPKVWSIDYLRVYAKDDASGSKSSQ